MASYTFETVDIKEELSIAFKKELPKFGFSEVKVLKADPQQQAEIPCIGINRVEDGESNQSISDHVGDHYDKESQKYYKTVGTYFQESVEVRIWHKNADERDKLYRHVKAILLANRLPLVDKGLLNITLRGGRDEQDSSMQQATIVLYWASITMSFLNPLDVTFEEVISPISGIDVNQTFTTGGDL